MKKLSVLIALSTMFLVTGLCLQYSRASDSSKIVVDTSQKIVLSKPITDTVLVKGDSVIHISTDNTPPLFYRDLPKQTGGTIGTFFWSLAGVLIYFFLNYQGKKGRDSTAGTNEKFNLGVWLKDNLILFIMYCAGFFLLYWNAGSMHPLAAIAIGMSFPSIVDAVKKRFGSST